MPEEEIKRIERRELLHIVVIFLSAQFAGLFLASQLFNGLSFQAIQAAQVGATLQGSVEYAVYLIALVVAFSVILILIMRIYKADKLLYLIESVVIFSASFFVFATLLSSAFSFFSVPDNSFSEGALLVSTVALSILTIAIKNLVPRTRNYVTILVSAGVGLIWGYNFSFSATYILFVIFAIYDIIAVFITKHMVVMAKAMMDKNLTFLVRVGDMQALPEEEVSRSNMKYVRETDKAAKTDALYREIRSTKMVPVPVGNALGTGDIVIPMALAVAAFKVSLNFVLSFFIIIGALIGFVAIFFIMRKLRRALPALPPLLFGCSIGIALYYILYVLL